jgi:hypothetical protein
MESLSVQHIDSLPKDAREAAYWKVSAVCLLRGKGRPEDEVAKKAGFSSVEDMYFRLKRWGLSGLLPLEGDSEIEEESGKTSKTVGEGKARASGPVEQLPPASNAISLFREALEALARGNEELKHRKETRQGKHYPYRTVSPKTPSDEEWEYFADLLGLDSVAGATLRFGGGAINRGTSPRAPLSPNGCRS